jgi:hypothetical protein
MGGNICPEFIGETINIKNIKRVPKFKHQRKNSPIDKWVSESRRQF